MFETFYHEHGEEYVCVYRSGKRFYLSSENESVSFVKMYNDKISLGSYTVNN